MTQYTAVRRNPPKTNVHACTKLIVMNTPKCPATLNNASILSPMRWLSPCGCGLAAATIKKIQPAACASAWAVLG
jgi:hypothetical protein